MSTRRFTAAQVMQMRAEWRAGATATAIGQRWRFVRILPKILTGVTYKEVPGAITATERKARRRTAALGSKQNVAP